MNPSTPEQPIPKINNYKTPPSSPRSSSLPNIKMDHYNAKAYGVLLSEGNQAFIDQVFTDQDNPSRKLSYAEMRMRYG